MAPVNIAGQPMAAVRALRELGVDVTLLQYGRHAFGYDAADWSVDLAGRHRTEAVCDTLKQTLEGRYDIYHFWMCSLFTGGRNYPDMYGMDLPFLKARGKRIIFRTTGWDVRMIEEHRARNPHNAFDAGYDLGQDPDLQRGFYELLVDYVDQFLVQDPEMAEWVPNARVVPRGIDLDRWPVVGVSHTKRPLVVHAPSQPLVKGTPFLQRALEELAEEGVSFDVKLISGMQHHEAMQWYRRADLVVDQLHIGWYGVVAVEAMALGKPVVTYVREDLAEGFSPALPIANANPQTIKDVLRRLLTSWDERRRLAERSRPFVEDVHDLRRVAQQLRDVYAGVMDRPVARPRGYADLRWFVGQYKRVEALQERRELERRASTFDDLTRLRAEAATYETLRREVEASERRRLTEVPVAAAVVERVPAHTTLPAPARTAHAPIEATGVLKRIKRHPRLRPLGRWYWQQRRRRRVQREAKPQTGAGR